MLTHASPFYSIMVQFLEHADPLVRSTIAHLCGDEKSRVSQLCDRMVRQDGACAKLAQLGTAKKRNELAIAVGKHLQQPDAQPSKAQRKAAKAADKASPYGKAPTQLTARPVVNVEAVPLRRLFPRPLVKAKAKVALCSPMPSSLPRFLAKTCASDTAMA